MVEAFPVGCSVLVLFLYVLSFFRILSVSDYVAVAIVAAALIYSALCLARTFLAQRPYGPCHGHGGYGLCRR